MTPSLHIGVDEAGLGPNLGPLLIVATRWDGFDGPTDGLWSALAAVISQSRTDAGDRLLVGDSKLVYRGRQDAPTLHSAADALLHAADLWRPTLTEQIAAVDPDATEDVAAVPWFEEVETREPPSDALGKELKRLGISVDVSAAVVPAGRFNRRLDSADSKGDLLSRLSLQTLRRVWDPDGPAASVWCDKHGGRNRYDGLLLDVCGGAFVVRHEEGRHASRYTVNNTQLVFGSKSERHFPVAWASIVAKSLRQRSMAAFNRFWQTHQPDVRPTEGYPGDAARFAEAVAETRQRLSIDDRLFWRAK